MGDGNIFHSPSYYEYHISKKYFNLDILASRLWQGVQASPLIVLVFIICVKYGYKVVIKMILLRRISLAYLWFIWSAENQGSWNEHAHHGIRLVLDRQILEDVFWPLRWTLFPEAVCQKVPTVYRRSLSVCYKRFLRFGNSLLTLFVLSYN